jgi:hypothetical protein
MPASLRSLTVLATLPHTGQVEWIIVVVGIFNTPILPLQTSAVGTVALLLVGILNFHTQGSVLANEDLPNTVDVHNMASITL